MHRYFDGGMQISWRRLMYDTVMYNVVYQTVQCSLHSLLFVLQTVLYCIIVYTVHIIQQSTVLSLATVAQAQLVV